MSVYASGVAAYRDTTKWLAAFVPVTALVTAGVAVGPRVLRSLDAAGSVAGWLADYWLVPLCALALLGGIVAILWTGARVLSVEPERMDALLVGAAKGELAEAIGAGAALPYYLDKAAFDAELESWATAVDAGGTLAADDPRITRLAPAVELIREWSVYHRIQAPYRLFRLAFVVGSVAITLAILVAPVQLGSATPITEPTQVVVRVADEERLAEVSGCSDARRSRFTAIAGTWERPVLAVDGPGCRFGASWAPDPDEIELRLPSGS